MEIEFTCGTPYPGWFVPHHGSLGVVNPATIFGLGSLAAKQVGPAAGVGVAGGFFAR